MSLDRNGLLRLLHSLRDCNRPKDDTLLSKLLVLLTNYFHNSGNELGLTRSGIFDSISLEELEPDIVSFFLQLAGLCGSLSKENSEELITVENFLMGAIRSDSSDTSVLCGWLHGMRYIISKHTRKPICDDTLSKVIECLYDKRYFIRKECLSILECLINNCHLNEECEDNYHSVNVVINSILHNLKNDLSNVSLSMTLLDLLEKIYSVEVDLSTNSNNASETCRWDSPHSSDFVHIFTETIYKLPKEEAAQMARILNMLQVVFLHSSSSLPTSVSNYIEGILKTLIKSDDKIKILHTAGWMLACPSFARTHDELEHLCLSPLIDSSNDLMPNAHQITNQYCFLNSCFTSEILCLNFRQIIKLEKHFKYPDRIFEACMQFICRHALSDARSSHPSKCYYAALDVTSSMVSRLTERPSLSHKSSFVKLLLAFQEDQFAVSKILKVIEKILIKEGSDEEFAAVIFPSLFVLMQNNIWDIRDSVLSFVGQICNDYVSSRMFDQVTKHNLHQLVWKSLDDEEPYIRACGIKSLSSLSKCSSRFGVELNITPENVFRKISLMVESDEEAFARRSAINFITEHFCKNGECLLLSHRHDATNNDLTLLPADELQEHLCKVLMEAVSNDSDWEVKISVLKMFHHLVLCVLLEPMWHCYTNGIEEASIKPETSSTCGDGDCPNGKYVPEKGDQCLSGFGKHVASMALLKIFEASKDYDDGVRETAISIINSLEHKLQELKDFDPSDKSNKKNDLKSFVLFYCHVADVASFQQSSATRNTTDDANAKHLGDLNAVLESISLCLVPYATHTEESFTSDEEYFTDFNMVDCYN